MKKLGWLFLALGITFFSQPVLADQTQTLCSVRGVVQSVMQEEMDSFTLKKRVMVPVVVVDIAAMVPADAGYKGDYCNQVAPAPAAGGKRVGYFRLCDANAEFISGQTITGVVGLSQGGGRLCLAQIQVQPTE